MPIVYRWSGWRTAHSSDDIHGWWTAHINDRHFACTVVRSGESHQCGEYQRGFSFAMLNALHIDDLYEDGRLSYYLMGAPTEDDFNRGFAKEKSAAREALEIFMQTAWMTPQYEVKNTTENMKATIQQQQKLLLALQLADQPGLLSIDQKTNILENKSGWNMIDTIEDRMKESASAINKKLIDLIKSKPKP